MTEHVCVLICRNAAASAYNAPVAYPQPPSAALPMDYGQGLCQTVDISKTRCYLHKQFHYLYVLIATAPENWLSLLDNVTPDHCHSFAGQSRHLFIFGKMSSCGCIRDIVSQPSWPHLPNPSHYSVIIYRQSGTKPFSHFLMLCFEFFYVTLR